MAKYLRKNAVKQGTVPERSRRAAHGGGIVDAEPEAVSIEGDRTEFTVNDKRRDLLEQRAFGESLSNEDSLLSAAIQDVT